MRVIGLLRRKWPEAAWAAFAIANFVAMVVWPGWETIPFHFVWISLTLLYGFRVWRPAATYLTLVAGRGRDRRADPERRVLRRPALGRALRGAVDVGDVPRDGLARSTAPGRARHRRASGDATRFAIATARAFPARRVARATHAGHDRARSSRGSSPHERQRGAGNRRCTGRARSESNRFLRDCCCLRRQTSPTSSSSRRSTSSRAWRMSSCAGPRWPLAPGSSVRSRPGSSAVDPEGLRTALDALLENAVKYTERGDTIELRSRASGGDVVIEVEDSGEGVPARRRSRKSSSGSGARTLRGHAFKGASVSVSRSSTRSRRRTEAAAL